MESLCPIILLVILIDCTRLMGWAAYQRDASIYATIAWFWRDGLIPYRDIWEFKPPLIFVVLRAGFALWGWEPENLRRLFLILTTLGAVSVYAGLRRARCLIAAPVAALGLMTLVVGNAWALPLQNTETLVAAFGTAAIGCAAAHQRNPRWWWAVLTGVCLGLATMGKQPAAVYSAALGMQLCLWGAPRGWWPRVWYVLTRALLGASGVALIVGAFVLYFASHGAVAAFYNAVLVDGMRYSGVFSPVWFDPEISRQLAWQRTPTQVRTVLQIRTMWPFLGVIGALIALTLLRPSRWTVTAWTWLLTAALAVLAGRDGENHYLIMTFPALVFTTGIVCERLWPARGELEPGHEALRLFGGVAAAVLLYASVWNAHYLPGRTQGAGADPVEAQARIFGQQIHAAARPGDTFLVEEEPIQIYIYAGIPPASRFIYGNAPNPYVDAELAAALHSKPAFIFVMRASAERLRRERANPAERSNHPWAQVLAESYEEWLTSPVIGSVYRRRAGDSNRRG